MAVSREMCTNSWPMHLDYSKDDCRRMLRALELTTYSQVVSSFRAQGDLTKRKKAVLQDMQEILGISTDRHRAEVRRATNDEKLTTIADTLTGSESVMDWWMEGRRVVPLMPRLIPQTAFTVTANSAANQQAERNLSLPPPRDTANKDPVSVPVASPLCPVATEGSSVSRPPSPSTTSSSNIVVLPSGMAIHIKGGLDEVDETGVVRRRRSSSAGSESVLKVPPTGAPPQQSQVLTRPSPMPLMQQGSAPLQPGTQPPSSAPMKITFAKSPTRAALPPPAQKLILVSSAQTSGTPSPTILQRSLSAGSKPPPGGPGLTGGAPLVAPRGMPAQLQQPFTPTPHTHSAQQYMNSSNNPAMRPRCKMVATPRPPRAPGGPWPQGHNVHIRAGAKPSLHLKQDGGMKIITQGVVSSTKILPKPIPATSPSASVMASRPAQSGAPPGRVLSITQGGRLLASSSRAASTNVVTVNPKTLQLTAIKGAAGNTVMTSAGRVAAAPGAKPNVIVVQKAATKRGSSPGTPTTLQVGKGGVGPYEKELMSFIQRQDGTRVPAGRVTMTSSERKPIPQKPAAGGDAAAKRPPIMLRQRLNSASALHNAGTAGHGSLLADLVHAVTMEGGQAADTDPGHQPLDTLIVSEDGQLAPGAWVQEEPDAWDGGTLITSLDGESLAGVSVATGALSHAHDGSADNSPHLSNVQYIQMEKGAQPVAVQVADSSDMLGGDIDPRTGMIFSTESGEDVELIMPQQGHNAASKGGVQTASISDFLSDVLSQAQIDLQPYEYVEEAALATSPVGNLHAAPNTGVVASIQKSLSSEGRGVSSLPGGPGALHRVITSLQGGTDGSRRVMGLSSSIGGAAAPAHAPKHTLTSLLQNQLNQQGLPDAILLDEDQVVDREREVMESHGAGGDVYPAPTLSQAPAQPLASAHSSAPAHSFAAQPQSMAPASSHHMTSARHAASTPAGHLAESALATTSQSVRALLQAATNSPLKVAPSQLLQENSAAHHVIQHVTRTLNVTSSLPDVVNEAVSSVAGCPARVLTIDEFRRMVGANPPDHKPSQSVTVESVESSSSPGQLSGLTAAQQLQQQDYDDSELDSDQPGSAGEEGQRGLQKRKRRLTPVAEESLLPDLQPWVRLALLLLSKVSRFRGNKDKGELNASVWFLQPVDTNDVLDYLEVVERPMDFGTIRNNLLCGVYTSWDDFHDDMMLVRDNCLLYNPPGSTVRHDCQQVFQYYLIEYEKTLDKWRKGQVMSPISKKPKLVESRTLSSQ